MLSGKNQKLIRTSAYQYEDELQYENKFAILCKKCSVSGLMHLTSLYMLEM